jgi:hypothetical protein
MFNLRNRSFLKEVDFEPRELRFLLQLAEALKTAKYAGTEAAHLAGKEIALIFEKTSTRTRSAFGARDAPGSRPAGAGSSSPVSAWRPGWPTSTPRSSGITCATRVFSR